MLPKSPRIRQGKQTSLSSIPQKGSPRALYSKSLISVQAKKRHIFGQRNLKKENVFADKENNKKLLNKIPRAVLLTPSSSDNSLTTTVSSNGQPSYTVMPKTSLLREPSSLTPYLSLNRQQTSTLINFRVRKSLSQMDFKEARRTGSYQLMSRVSSPKKAVQKLAQNEAGTSSLEGKMTQLVLQDNALIEGQLSFVVGPDQDARVASLRIFNTIMLHAWRRRREEVRQLSDQVEDYKKSFVKNRNQLHVYNSLFSVEKRRNETLNDQLRQSYRENAQTKLSYEELSLMLVQIRTEKEKLSEELAIKDRDIGNLQEMQQSLRSELFQVNSQQREQLKQLTSLQRDYQESQSAQDELVRQLDLLQIDLALKRDFIDQLRENMAKLEDLKKVSDKQYSKLLEQTLKMERSLEEKEEQLVTLQNCLSATLGQRIRQCFAQSQAYQHATYRMLHFVAHYMLPGTPPPTPSLPGAVTRLKGFFSRGSENRVQEVDHFTDLERVVNDQGQKQENLL
ncbi:coiled-coil domain-containing protein 102A [Drosophila biarmipes]|uniref:coiled-coil domain-containing protein 102A n=1 Tax=Drosophila biarmipes TaxID=125945 RepID=UPI0007E7096B|nr:coiled-coil domain-containing protein 102A [Drosophila biarmipes]